MKREKETSGKIMGTMKIKKLIDGRYDTTV